MIVLALATRGQHEGSLKSIWRLLLLAISERTYCLLLNAKGHLWPAFRVVNNERVESKVRASEREREKERGES